MKKKLKILALSLITGFSFLAFTASTIAWFSAEINFNFGSDPGNLDVSGGSNASYYESGSGTSNDPYIISDSTHLYNLAWLQYIGYYNSYKTTFQENAPSDIVQCYFKLKNSIDMNGLTLPPIGTEIFPFLGNFDGNNCTISNFTISNDDPTLSNSDFGVAKPSNIYGGVQPDVVGFFGVVGELTNQSITYDSSIVGFYDCTLSNFTVKAKTNQVLIGLAAGYVNGDMSGIKVGGTATLDVNGQTSTAKASITNKLSDYGLVGYTTKTGSAGSYSQKLSEFFTNSAAEEEALWGGTINMKNLHQRLEAIKTNTKNQTNGFTNRAASGYAYRTHVTASTEGGETTYIEGDPDLTNDIISYSDDNNGKQIGNATQYYKASNDNLYLMGGHQAETSTQTVNRKEFRFITDGTNFLGVKPGYMAVQNYTGITENGNNSQYCKWVFSSTTSGSSDITIKCVITDNNVTTEYYLKLGGAITGGKALTISTTDDAPSTRWYIHKEPNDKLTIKNQGADAFVCYEPESTVYPWMAKTTGNTGFLIHTGNKYLGLGSKITGTTYFKLTVCDRSEASLFNYYTWSGHRSFVTPNSTAGYSQYTQINYETISKVATPVISRYGYSREFYIISDDFSNGRIVDLTGKMRAYNTTYYLKYDSGTDAWIITNEAGGDTFTAEYQDGNVPDSQLLWSDGVDIVPGPGSMQMTYDKDDTTYIPLNVTSDGTFSSKTNYQPTVKNTGYLTAGSVFPESGTPSGDDWIQYSPVVVSKSSSSVILNSYSGGNISHIYTKNSSGQIDLVSNSASMSLYDESLEILESEMLGNDIYGVHFNEATISSSNKVTANYALINRGEENEASREHTNYELPLNCMDVSLAERGLISFYAGTYITGNSTINTMLSLYKVVRNANGEITDILEISEIYSDSIENHSYVYKYNNNKYSLAYQVDDNGVKTTLSGSSYTPSDNENSVPNGYTSIFSSSWITGGTSYTQNALYYFEIPVDEGEFALGSTTGKTGGYLLYLSVGASGPKNDEISAYSVTTLKTANNYPVGVDFIPVEVTGSGGDTIAVSIDSGNKGVITFVITANDISVTDSSSIAEYAYRSSKYKETNPSSSQFTCNMSGDPPSLSSGGTRVLTINLAQGNGTTHVIEVIDILTNDAGAFSESSSTYVVDGVISNKSAVEALSDVIVLADLRDLTIVTTLSRTAGTNEFVTTYDVDNCSYDDKAIDVDITLNGCEVTVGTITAGYSFYVGGVRKYATNTINP